MKFTLTLTCDNAAFEGAPLSEIARILREQANKMERFYDQPTWSDSLRDLNSNTVGSAKITGKQLESKS